MHEGLELLLCIWEVSSSNLMFTVVALSLFRVSLFLCVIYYMYSGDCAHLVMWNMLDNLLCITGEFQDNSNEAG